MVSEKIKSLRVKNSLTQTQLAEILDCSVATISGYEKGKTEVPAEIIIKCANYFGCPPEYFYNTDIPLMEAPEALEKLPYKVKMKVIRDLSKPVSGSNICGEINHPYCDIPVERVVWRMTEKDETKDVIILVDKTPREGERIAVVTDKGESKLGYYYIDENHNVCVKSKQKGHKGIRNIKVSKIYGIVERIIIE